MKRTVNGDCFPTFRRIGGKLVRAAKWTGKALVILVILLAVAHGIATFITGRKLESDIRALKAKGELPSITELVGPKVPDAENASLVYAEAFKLLPSPGTDREDYEQLSDFADAEKRKADPGSWDKACAAIGAYDRALELAERAASMERCRFPVKWEDGFAALFPHYRSLRGLARLANARGLIAARDGKMDEAARFMGLSLRIARSVEGEPTLISVLVRAAIINMTCRNLRDAAPYVSLTEDQTARLSESLAEADLRPHYRLAMQGERDAGLLAFRELRDDPSAFGELTDVQIPLARLTVFAARPVLYADERFYLGLMGKIIADAEKPIRDSGLKDLEGLHLLYRPVTSMILPVVSGVKSRVYEALAETRVCRVGLELSAYERRHGTYPDSLAGLGVSDPEMLEDPLSGKALIYKRQGKGFVLYSVGKDMKDDGGKPLSDGRSGPSKGDIAWRVEK